MKEYIHRPHSAGASGVDAFGFAHERQICLAF